VSWRLAGLLTALFGLLTVGGCKKAAGPSQGASSGGSVRPGPAGGRAPEGNPAAASAVAHRVPAVVVGAGPVPELESKLERMIALMKEVADSLEKVQDERSAEAAGPVLWPMMEEVNRLVEETAIGKSPLPRDQYQEIYDRYRARIFRVGDRYMAQKTRLLNDGKLWQAFSRTGIIAGSP